MTDYAFGKQPPEGGRICVVGAGFMGCVIATLYVHHGYDVVICDSNPAMLDSYSQRARPIAAGLVESDAQVEALLQRVVRQASLPEAVDGAFMVHEAIQESLEIKQALFEELDRLCPDSVVLATNTSSLPISDIAKRLSHKERVIGIHYVTPGHIVPVVELIHSPTTPPELIAWARAMVKSIDHVGVACLERPGFLVNKIQFAMLTEIYRLMDEGLATREDIDDAVRLSLGPRLALWGPLLTEDLIVSKKTALAVTDSIYQQTGDETYKGRKVLRDLVAQDHLGAINGAGWYRFKDTPEEVVAKRDRQLRALLDWLQEADPVGELNVR
ncbi:3-hydroxyacyl-CoA dehydrogenase family protein [Salipiger abyssi]|uniref:3-hydroxyacyl-CoA dehydrogenase family protein n=1 Tax=Salipiger abyssi TaxID=1250539 RepID=UPI001A8CC243|nr:3-hydroxyacyl-CoA dehydrogenase family protein [Salipiger abyssi]MBN9888911.1 3-hydroxyacyl-CoA dehydrogenase family protein [Salipiger abyssi]